MACPSVQLPLGVYARKPIRDRDALLTAIIAAPEDDAPRLVMADWLDEHGDYDRTNSLGQIELRTCQNTTPVARTMQPATPSA